MFAVEGIAGQGVIELVLTILPIDQIVRPSLVFDMASLAGRVGLGAVEPLVSIDPFLNHSMARETFFRNQLPPRSMAFGAVLHAFEKGVRLVEFSG